MSLTPKPLPGDPRRTVIRVEMVGFWRFSVWLRCGHHVVVDGRAPAGREVCRRCGSREESAGVP